MSDEDEELEEGEAGISGESTESFRGLGGATAEESRRSSGLGLDRLGRCTERVD